MADESNPSSAPEAAAVAPEAPVKKQRAPRVKKTDAKAATTTAEPVKKNRGGRPKRTEATATPAVASSTATRGKRAASAPSAAGKRGPNRAAKPATAVSPLADDLADLLQLEEENQRLRKSLAEKLRAENSDLRNRLGIK
ncbi:hypothetical protein ACCS54_03805 [Rhizobium johnstonii]|jgi:hypothetical protein|uniref:hypothetical protein n=1 Tax=Rhizobium TaxID=379 RepID=UPI00140FC911|nr:hypothetical protein [Rhizobium leguminosarum]QIO63991.1 hypothetical protein HA462_02515 [Rhizobium leguminosarum bv. trifolii]